ncbi:MAG TPA: hypothetical protein PKA28_02545 [Methylomusa anaerophila]|uniref:Uncharacterized protein n=1 Tax=Methylomusa anaerophila TaxID=1930071 RepID=A0A348AP50_9FIRM|nr:hypothetical protein [Methylomusa anaerophila]BBB92848.1 hypothetical protein MAMMFC1_03556 [Methylomusa anaerophila]HML87313.1 hypothetical protein [Methylomusa anaerophila]
MRLRRRRNKRTIDISAESPTVNEPTVQKDSDNQKQVASKKSRIKKEASPAALFRKIVENPNFNAQFLVIVLSLMSGNVPMDRGISSMSSAVDKVRNITEVITSTMQSVKVATEAPKQIKRLLQ